MEIIKNINIPGAEGRTVLADLFYKNTSPAKPVVIFCHGFKGFKDWGAWNLVARYFAEKGYIFIKFNFSHNGTTPDNPDSFADLEAFGNNTFTREMADLDAVMDWMQSTPLIPEAQRDLDRIYLIGHSRGGGIAILKAQQDERVKKLATWASVNNLGYAWTPEVAERWKEKGVMFVENARTKQQMPMYYSLYEDFMANRDSLDVQKAVRKMHIPFIIIHGTEDEAVPFEHALEMKRWNPQAKLDLIPQGSHTFGLRHPFEDHHLPFDMQIVMEHTHEFFKDN